MYNTYMVWYLRNNLPFLFLTVGVMAYILYFSLFSILRYEKFYAHYFDLGIMHQTVYNSYQGIKIGDLSRILEHTDPQSGTEQVKRMAVHNDIFLVFLAPFYFIHDGPATLLVIQSIVVGLGAYFVFLIAQLVFREIKYAHVLALLLAYGYLLYPPLEKANNFDFHAVTLATTFLLAMYYFWLKKQPIVSLVFAVISMLTKEQVGLTVAFFGAYTFFHASHYSFPLTRLIKNYIFHRSAFQNGIAFLYKKEHRFGIILIISGIFWVLFSLNVIIPYFRGGEHFGSKYFTYLKDTPWKIVPIVFRLESARYISLLLIPVGLVSLFAPLPLLIATPEIAMNLLSINSNMRNIYFHYDSVITPFVFISAIYGVHFLLTSKFEKTQTFIRTMTNCFGLSKKKMKYTSLITQNPERSLIVFLATAIAASSLYMSPLPWGHHRDIFPWQAYPEKYADVQLWKLFLKDDSVKVSATGHLAPHFASRRYFYNFAEGYNKADYVVIDRFEIARGFQTELKYDEYQHILRDFRFVKIYDVHGIEVFKRLLF